MAESSAYITIRFEGPEIKAGRMRLDNLIEAARECFCMCYAFWENLSAEQYAERQGGRPIEQAESLYGAGQADDWEGFDEALEDWRTPRQRLAGENP